MISKDLSIYIHIPFCVRKCHYCDFLSFPADEAAREAYVRTLLAEIRLEAKRYPGYRIRTIFFGGGTPSLLTAGQIQDILSCLSSCFPEDSDQGGFPGVSGENNPEVSMEVNPGTVTEEKLAGYRAAGVNRLSIGLQSADDRELKKLGRIHTYDMFLETYHRAVRSGFTNINIDLMSALPGQTEESYRATLEKVLALTPAPTHISAYSLIVEEGTPFGDWMDQGTLHLPSEEAERDMYELTGQMLEEAGYGRYEISNYAKAGYACRHNLVYWTQGDYLGLGLGAASLMDNVRMSNERDLQAYTGRIEVSGEKPERQVLTRQAQMEETMFLGLRKMEGVSKAHFRSLYGCNMEEVYGEVIDKHVKNGLLRDGDFVALTPKGIDVSNYVMADFLLD